VVLFLQGRGCTERGEHSSDTQHQVVVEKTEEQMRRLIIFLSMVLGVASIILFFVFAPGVWILGAACTAIIFVALMSFWEIAGDL
jgi:VIT1/CCC1 family predicted Fe2+/Mn2+ transporter